MEQLAQQIAQRLGLDLRGLPMDHQGLYQKDWGIWAHIQAEAIKRGDFGGVDWPNVIEEIDWVGRRTRDTWRSHCQKALLHMLKVQYARPRVGFKARDKKIRKARDEMSAAIRSHPAMTGPVLDDLFADAWRGAKGSAVVDLGYFDCPPSGLKERELKDLIPDECPWSLVEVAGYNPRHQPSAGVADDRVLPAVIAQRLNQELAHMYPECGWDAACHDGPAVRRKKA